MTFLRVIAVVGAVAALCGCASEPSAYETAVAEITARHREALERVARDAERERAMAHTEAKRLQAEDRTIAKMRESLHKFLAERAPRSCGSQHLVAMSGPPSLVAQIQASRSEADNAFTQRVGAAILDIADAVQQAGCHAAARQLYDDALRTFIGPSHADLRLRAQFAVASITRSSTKQAPVPTQAASAQ
jgi:hypothetical protein